MPDAIRAGSRAPAFRLPSTDGDVSLDALLAGERRAVVAFYFEDGTPACETEVAMLRDSQEMLREFRAAAVAISADSIESHRAFVERIGGVTFPLASDADLAAARAYGVVDEGDTRRARRAIFVIDADGTVLLALVPFQPGSMAQVGAIFAALGMEA